MSIFCFIDKVTEVKKNQSLTAFYTLKSSEEFLKDHFNGFPVMPGVLLLESLKQAASTLLTLSEGVKDSFYRLVNAEDIRFGQFVKPGNSLKLSVQLLKREGSFIFFEGRIDLVNENSSGNARKALTANFALTPLER